MGYKLLTPVMTSDTTPSGIVSASHYHNENYRPFYAFDQTYGNDQQTWATTQSLPQWIQYQFPRAKVVKRLITVNRNERNIRAVKKFTFQGSLDGSSWTNISECTINSSAAHYKETFDFLENTTEYTHYRLYITEQYSNTGTGCGFAEIEMYGDGIDVESTAGDTLAIRDWFNSKYYTQRDINGFVKNLKAGYLAYEITFISSKKETVIVTGLTSCNSYTIEVDGSIKKLLFFIEGETIDYGYGTRVLDERRITLKLSKYSETVLWNYVTDNAGSIYGFGGSYTVTLHEAIENYDKIIMETFPYNDTSGNNNRDNFVVMPVKPIQEAYRPGNVMVNVSNGIWKDRWARMSMSGTTFSKAYDKYGTSFGKSLGLVKVIGSKVSCSYTKLWDYVADNAGNFSFGSATLTLHDAIENYDEILFEILGIAADLDADHTRATYIITIPVYILAHNYRPNYFNFTTWDTRSTGVYMAGTTLTREIDNAANTNGFVKVWGVKYG